MKYDGIHAARIIEKQNPDGAWGQFHSLSASNRRDKQVTTEMALRRLQNLGFAMEDACIRRAVDYMDTCLRGQISIPDPREKLHDWDAFTDMMLAAWIRRFTPDNPRANAVADLWTRVIGAAFAGETCDQAAYADAFTQALGHKPRGGRFVDFVSLYQVSITTAMFDEVTDARFVRHVLHHPQGIYYVYDRPLCVLPEVFASKQTTRWLAAIDLLAEHPTAKAQLGFAADWLLQNRNPDGTWDLSPAAKDDITLPLSDSWRKAEARIADCTAYIERVLAKI